MQPVLNGAGAGAARALPMGDDRVWREIRALKDAQAQNLAAMRHMVDPLADAIATLSTQQATLTAQQATLTTAVGNIATLVSQQVTGATGHSSQTADLTTTEASYASFAINVPVGYSRAEVMGVASLYCSGGAYAYLRCRIAGQNGETQYALGVSGGVGNATASHSRSLTGLSGGSITIEARANTATSTVTAVMVVAAQVTFLR